MTAKDFTYIFNGKAQLVVCESAFVSEARCYALFLEVELFIQFYFLISIYKKSINRKENVLIKYTVTTVAKRVSNPSYSTIYMYD